MIFQTIYNYMKKFIALKLNGNIKFPLVTRSSIIPIDGSTQYFGEPVVPCRKNSHVYAYQMLNGLMVLRDLLYMETMRLE